MFYNTGKIRANNVRAAQHDFDESLAETATIPSVEADLDGEDSGAESEASAGAGSTGALDRTEEDFTREGAKMTGFMGKNSEITWMQRLKQENKYGSPPKETAKSRTDQLSRPSNPSLRAGRDSKDYSLSLQEADDGFTIHESSYHLNDLAISTFEAVDPYEMPTSETAHLLFTTYIQRVHPSFPLVSRLNLQNQFQKFLSKPSTRPPAKWLAIINLIFAISAKYSHLIQAEWQADERDHLIYFSRARLLSIDTETLFNHPDLQMIQIFSLMAVYLMVTNQINRFDSSSM